MPLVVLHPRAQHEPQVPLAEWDLVIEALAA
jgi:hypothetical protein